MIKTHTQLTQGTEGCGKREQIHVDLKLPGGWLSEIWCDWCQKHLLVTAATKKAPPPTPHISKHPQGGVSIAQHCWRRHWALSKLNVNMPLVTARVFKLELISKGGSWLVDLRSSTQVSHCSGMVLLWCCKSSQTGQMDELKIIAPLGMTYTGIQEIVLK